MIEKVVIISFLVFATYITMQDDMIFDRLGHWFEKILPEWFHKPAFACVICMGGIYGAAWYWLVYGLLFQSATPKEWIVVNLSVIGLNAILTKLFPDG